MGASEMSRAVLIEFWVNDGLCLFGEWMSGVGTFPVISGAILSRLKSEDI